MSELRIPATSLVVLIGTSGSGKSTFAAEQFGSFEVISSDYCRGIVSNDVNDQSASAAAFDLLHHIAGVRLSRGLLTVVDATNLQRENRRPLIQLAKDHNVLPVAIVLDVPESVALQRHHQRADRDFGDHVIRRQRSDLRRGLRGLEREGFRSVHVLRSVEDIDSASVVRTPLLNDRRDLHGPFDIIGDVHGCLGELLTLLGRLGYDVRCDEHGRPIDAINASGRTAIFLGDLVDRGPDSPGVLRLVMGMTAARHALAIPGNHENKLERALDGRKVQVSHGLAETLDQLGRESEEFRSSVRAWLRGLIAHLVLDDGRLVVAHAGLKEAYHGRASGRVRSFALYGDTTGETDEFGLPVRYPWASEYRGRAMVVYGHTPTPTLDWVNNTMCLDTGCVFGGQLSALRYPERETIQVPAERVWYEPVRPLLPAGEPSRARAGLGDHELDVADVLGQHAVQTRHLGRVTVRAEQGAGALEVISRYAIAPRWLAYLPPTMSPVPTSTHDDLLEHPDQAWSTYASAGVRELVCQEKHMGSRAVVVLCRGVDVAARRFHSFTGDSGAVYTRTGRSFFDQESTEAFLSRLRSATDAAGLWDELGSDWLILDAELLPWSLKAQGLLREQYAAVGASARRALRAADEILQATWARGIDVGELRERSTRRRHDAAAFTTAYRRYCWPTTGLDGVQLAPFQILASEGATHEERPHDWHLGLIDRLVAADSGLLRRTERRFVDLDDEQSRAGAAQWWLDLTAAGGEGMVVKPRAGLVRTSRGKLVQPGLKVRGREYLRIVYGPEYLAELPRLRARRLAHKQSMALREYALGLESLARFCEGEPLWRVHEPVFAVLALESEPVDPRL